MAQAAHYCRSTTGNSDRWPDYQPEALAGCPAAQIIWYTWPSIPAIIYALVPESVYGLRLDRRVCEFESHLGH